MSARSSPARGAGRRAPWAPDLPPLGSANLGGGAWKRPEVPSEGRPATRPAPMKVVAAGAELFETANFEDPRGGRRSGPAPPSPTCPCLACPDVLHRGARPLDRTMGTSQAHIVALCPDDLKSRALCSTNRPKWGSQEKSEGVRGVGERVAGCVAHAHGPPALAHCSRHPRTRSIRIEVAGAFVFQPCQDRCRMPLPWYIERYMGITQGAPWRRLWRRNATCGRP